MRKSQLYSIAFGFSLLVLVFFSLLLYNSINSLNGYSYWVERSNTVMLNLAKLQSYMNDAETSQRGFLLSRDSSFMEPLLESRARIPKVLDTLLILTREEHVNYSNIVDLQNAAAVSLQAIEETLPKRRYFDDAALKERLRYCKSTMNAFREKVKRIEGQEHALLVQRAESKKTYERITPNYFKMIFSITTVIALISFVLLLNELRQRLASQRLLEMKFHALNQSNAELQQIAHVTSHDLQEPLRKIRTFSDILVSRYAGVLNEEGRVIISRIDQNAVRMKELVADLSSFTSLATSEEHIKTDLNKIMLDVQHEMSARLLLTRARIKVSTLPVMSGSPQQLHILFRELVDNALKFVKKDRDPQITITANHIRGDQLEVNDHRYRLRNFVVINIYDNGIGFDGQYINKIFVLFQRLHGHDSPYDGKGIGLAMCQRIMSNHDGFITAEGIPDRGATFHLYFPADL